MKHPPCSHLCPRFQAAMEVLAKPWNGLIMATLAHGTLRFSELKLRLAAMGDRMLSARLKELEARGLVERRVSPGPPVRVDYALTEVGLGFNDVVAALGNWGSRFLEPTSGPRASRSAPPPRAKKVRAGKRAALQ